MTAEADIAAVADGGDNTPGDVRTALTSVLGEVPIWMRRFMGRVPGETSHADDKFFPDGSAHGGTVVTPSGTATWLQEQDVLAGIADDNVSQDANCLLWPLTPTTAPITIEVAMRDIIPPVNFAHAGLCFTDGTAVTSKIVMGVHYQSIWDSKSGTIQLVTTNHTAITTGSAPVQALPWAYLRLIWIGTDSWSYGRSVDGVLWTYAPFTTTSGPSPTHFGLELSAYGSGLPVQAAWEYIRVAEADLSA